MSPYHSLLLKMPPPQNISGAMMVVFSSDVKNMDEWARRTGIPLTTAESLGATFARAHRWLLELKGQLISHYGWGESQPSDPRLLFSVDSPSIWRSSAGLPTSPSLRLQIPLHATSFFSPDRRVQWEMVFHSDIFQTNRKLCPPINDILNLLQCLLTGMFTVIHEETVADSVYKTIRGLPGSDWVMAHQVDLIDILGHQHYRELYKACCNRSVAYKLDVIPRER